MPPRTRCRQRLARPSRRSCLQALAAACPMALVPVPARLQPAAGGALLTVAQMTGPIVGAAAMATGGLRLEAPALADNGHAVPVRVIVDSPMTEAEHVTHIWLLSPRNPVTRMAVFHLGPWSGRAEMATRVRLAGTQSVVALARLSDGRFRVAETEVVVTESACLDAS